MEQINLGVSSHTKYNFSHNVAFAVLSFVILKHCKYVW